LRVCAFRQKNDLAAGGGGSVIDGGRNANNYRKSNYHKMITFNRAQLALVSQEPVLFDATVAENIWLGCCDRAAAAAAAAGGGSAAAAAAADEWDHVTAAAIEERVKLCQVLATPKHTCFGPERSRVARLLYCTECFS
jgi:hypothetical protein